MQQRPDIPRETFIALRARRKAYRIATDFLYRDSESLPEPLPAIPLQAVNTEDRRTPPWLRRFAIVVLAAVLFCVIVILSFSVVVRP